MYAPIEIVGLMSTSNDIYIADKSAQAHQLNAVELANDFGRLAGLKTLRYLLKVCWKFQTVKETSQQMVDSF